MIIYWLYLFIFLQFIIPSAVSLILVATLAGTSTSGNTNGVGTNSRFYIPQRGDISPDGTIYILADSGNQLIRQVIISTSTVSTLAGKASGTGVTNGEGTNAQFNNPSAVAYSPDGSYALVADFSNNLIRKIIISTAVVTKIAGGGSSGTSSGNTNGAGTTALFDGPDGITISPDGLTAVVADSANNMIRKIIISTSAVSTLAGRAASGTTNGIGTAVKFNGPSGVDYYPDGSAVLVADRDNYLIRKIIIATAEVTTLAGVAATAGSTNGIGTNSRFNYPYDIRISPEGSYALVADRNNHMIRSIILTTLFVDIVTGTTTYGTANGVGTNAQLNYPRGVAISPNGEYFLISDTYNQMIRYAEITDPPTRMPTVSPTLSPPSSCPSSQPSSSPSISFQPTATCPPGYIRDINNEEDPTSCKGCEEGSYSEGGNENSCHACPPSTWNIGSGNTDCEYTTIRDSASDGYPITFCVLYAVLSMVCFGLTLRLGGSWTAIINIVLITSDQISDILYFWYSLFADPSLLYLSITFCLLNLLIPTLYLLWHLSFYNILAFQWLELLSQRYHQYYLAHGHEGETEHPKYASWVFHWIFGWDFGELFPFSLIFLVVDLAWIILRIFIMIFVVFVSIFAQVLLLIIGVVLCASKLMSIPVVEIWFWRHWNRTFLETNPDLFTDDSPVVFNTLVLLEVCSESVPQMLIQITNSELMSVRWTPLAIFSVIMSVCMIISTFHHFWYKHQKLLRKGDPTYTSFDYTKIPKYDLSEKFFLAISNQRKIAAVPVAP